MKFCEKTQQARAFRIEALQRQGKSLSPVRGHNDTSAEARQDQAVPPVASSFLFQVLETFGKHPPLIYCRHFQKRVWHKLQAIVRLAIAARIHMEISRT